MALSLFERTEDIAAIVASLELRNMLSEDEARSVIKHWCLGSFV